MSGELIGNIILSIVVYSIVGYICYSVVIGVIRRDIEKELKERDDQITAILRVLVASGILIIEKNEKGETRYKYIN